MTRRENLLRVIHRESPGWIPYRYDGSLTFLKPPTVVRPPNGGLDDWGVRWIASGTSEGSYPDEVLDARAPSADSFRVPDTDFRTVTLVLKEQVKQLSEQDTLVIASNELTLFERARLLMGTSNFLMATAQEPERVVRLLEAVTEYQVELTVSMLEAGVSGVRFTDDWGTQTSLFISPEQWRRLVKPCLRRLYRSVQGRDGLVFQHSCGHIGEILPDLIEIGVHVIDPCQPAANDIFEWKRRYGDRLSFMGGLDTQGYLTFGDPAEVRSQVKHVAATMGAGGGYIAAPSHSISIPPANAHAIVQALRELNVDRAGRVPDGQDPSSSRV